MQKSYQANAQRHDNKKRNGQTEKGAAGNKKLALVVAHLEKQIISNKFSLKVSFGSCFHAQPTPIFNR